MTFNIPIFRSGTDHERHLKRSLVFAVLANRCDRLTSTVMRHAVNQLAVSHAVDVDARHLKYLNPNINLSNIRQRISNIRYQGIVSIENEVHHHRYYPRDPRAHFVSPLVSPRTAPLMIFRPQRRALAQASGRVPSLRQLRLQPSEFHR